MNTEIQKLQDEVISKAIALINTDELAASLALKLKSEIEEAFQHNVNDIDLAYWIKDELEDDSTPNGKAFAKAVSKITKGMIASIGQ